MKKITTETKISEILKKKSAEAILEKFHFPCLHCPMAKMEMEHLNLGQVCDTYGIDLEKLLRELNNLK